MKVVIESTKHFIDGTTLPLQYLTIDCDIISVSKFGDLLLKPVIEFESMVKDSNNLKDDISKEYTASIECLITNWLDKTILIKVKQLNKAELTFKIHSMKSYEENQRQRKGK